MDRMVVASRRRSLTDRVESATRGIGDLDLLAHTVFGAVAVDIPHTFACMASTDPSTELITRAFKSAPLPIGDEEFAATEYGAPDVNQFAEIARRPVPVGALSVDTQGRPQQCRRLRDYMTPRFGFTDELRLACLSGHTMWGALALYRGDGEAPFTREEAARLAGIHPVVADRIRSALFAANSWSRSPDDTAAVLIVDAQDRVSDMTTAAHERIDDLGGWEHGSLPGNVLVVAALARTSGAPATTRVLGLSGGWLTMRAMPLGGAGRAVAITIDAASATVVGELALAARGLTTRELDVVRLVLQGASTKAIADSLFLSPYTVQDHLKSVFRKLGVGSRREMIAALSR
ncbi:helix-turn-helix transcriptional regulator [Williamsia sterculiae]|uniref:Regulatory protein, luxR family n=1 Tax=Williamsia sterculiae TaxID=1344003 RepID=A0A1N7GY69_9NOCA|nr:helix-turn-helix transcriptional regulator [Williamsia sterculiae]SIS17466.1 regulatory protein, luxR family [Williamsia sterculiae]